MLPDRRRSLSIVVLLVVGSLVVIGGVLLMFTLRSSWRYIPVQAISASVSSSTLYVTVDHNQCAGDGVRVRVVSEDENEVVIAAEQSRAGDCNDIAMSSTSAVELSAVLGDRHISVEGGLFQPPACLVDGVPTDRCS